MIDVMYGPTRSTPHVLVNSAQGKIVFEGKSSPENSLKFYFPIIKRIEQLFQDYSGSAITMEMKLEYFNTSSSKCLFDLFKTMKKLERQGKNVVVNWYFEEDDIDMQESGEDYADLLGMDFNFIELSEEEFLKTA